MRDVDVCGARRSLTVVRAEHPCQAASGGGELSRAWLNFLSIDVVDLNAPLQQHHTFYIGSPTAARPPLDACLACAA